MGSEQDKIFERGQNLYFTEEMGVDGLVELTRRRLIELPQHIRFCVIVGPVRTGTTVLQLVASHLPNVAVAEFQPFKYWLRHGPDAPSFSYDLSGFNGQPAMIVIKETLGPDRDLECTLDPVGILLKAGISPGRISAIYTLRQPRVTFWSWNAFRQCRVEQYLKAHWKIWEDYQTYKNVIAACVPFYYEALRLNSTLVFSQLFRAVHVFDPRNDCVPLRFTEDVVRGKNRWNEADNLLYWETVVAPMISKGGFVYTDRADIPPFSAHEELKLHALQRPFEIWKKMTMLQLDLPE